MKKFFALIATIVLCVACAFGVAGCNSGNSGKYTVYAPDGAPALSVAGIHGTQLNETFDVKVVKADTITAYVNGENPAADFAIMPVNAAVKLLGSGAKYKMLGTVTHGNLFLMKKSSGAYIQTAADLTKLKGKTVGVINLANVPGLTFKVILKDNGIEFNELKDGGEVAADKVNLKNVTVQQAIPSNADCDYFVISEPFATTKEAATKGNLSFAGDLQALYGGENGYPQAVAVAKAEIAEKNPDAVSDFAASFSSTEVWLKSASAAEIANAVKAITEGDMSPMFTAENLSLSVIENCGIRFVGSAYCKAEVLAFMQKLNAVSSDAWGMPEDKFFYL